MLNKNILKEAKLKKILTNLLSLTVICLLFTGCGEDSNNNLAVQAYYAKGGINCGNKAKEAPAVCFVGKDVRVFHPGPELANNNFLFSLGKIEEVTPDGEVLSIYQVGSSDKGTYQPLVTNDGISHLNYNSVIKNPTFVGGFGKTIHFGIITGSYVEDILCAECSGGTEGICQNGGTKACADKSTTGSCPRRFSACSEDLVYHKDTIALSAIFTQLNFTDSVNKLRYTTQIKVMENAGSEDVQNTSPVLERGGLLEIPITATVAEPDGTKRIIDVQFTKTKIDDNTYEIVFEFPSVPVGDKIYYN